MADWILGVTCVLVGTFFSAVGMVLMKASAQVESKLPWHRRHRWFLGCTSLVVNATIMETIALALAPLSLLAPFAACTIVFSTLLARCGALSAQELVHETRWAAICVTLVGVTVVSLYGPHDGIEVTEDNVYRLLGNRGFVVFASVSTVVIALVCFLWYCEPAAMRKDRAIVPLLAYAAASCGALSLNFLKVLALALRSVVEPRAAGSRNELFALHSWLSLLALAVYAPLQLALLNTVLVHSPVSFAVPMYESLLILLSIVAGGTFYREFDGMSAALTYGFVAGVVVTVCGLGLLALSPAERRGHAHAQQSAVLADSELLDDGSSDGRMADALEVLEAEVGRAAAAVLGYEKPPPPQLERRHSHQRHQHHMPQSPGVNNGACGGCNRSGSFTSGAPAACSGRESREPSLCSLSSIALSTVAHQSSMADPAALDGYVRLEETGPPPQPPPQTFLGRVSG